MYRINYLNRNVLITPDEVLSHAATDQEINARLIQSNIINAEERFIAPALCDEFYEDFINQKNRIVTEENRAEIIESINSSSSVKVKGLPLGTIVNALEFVENEWYLKLWHRFLWKLTAESVDMMCIVPSWLRHTSAGQMLNNPKTIGGNEGGANSGDLKDIQFKLDIAIQDRIDPLMEQMKAWLCRNKTHFPLFCHPCDECGCNGNKDHKGVAHIRKTNLITNLYDD
ncbi:hypothetical protein ETU08_00015 [Apibacter muscae]|uniref:hypothetical protein n=1 Tax=Apibacter muscae TaxID=2509004 RepID=UPI0011AC8022|nr:hypothetical protein [Apibacter muscae]TWP31878.1 hypothetical protein ETU08_00015 [Apibacter muscae]